jgi:hypothetical protein
VYIPSVQIGIATCRPLPEPDPDQAPLTAALEARGAAVELVPWDVDFDWRAVDLCVLRSTWDYHRRPDAFLAWVEKTAKTTRLLNPPEVVRWNAHKEYLLELEASGLPVAPTALLRRGDVTTLRDVADGYGWDDVVVKPAVSASSHATIRAQRGGLRAAEAHLRELLDVEDVLVQGYLPSVEGHGERALVAIEGKLTHSVRKSRRFAGDAETVESVPIGADERALATRVLAQLPRLLYARVDVAPAADGTPCVMEVELIEPSLFVSQNETALHRLADAIVARAAD